MASIDRRDPTGRGAGGPPRLGGGLIVGLLALVAVGGWLLYGACRVEVGKGKQAVLIRKVGRDLEAGMEIARARSEEVGYTKGVQPEVLTEGRYFYNPFFWDWELSDQFEVPEGKCAVRVSLVGEELPEGRVLAEPGQKGIEPGVIEAGARVAYNPYATEFLVVEPIDVPTGGRGVVTLLAGREPKDPNVVLVDAGERGVQQETLPPGKYFINPFEQRINVVDCRSRTFGLNDDADITFLSADGFNISLDGKVNFRIDEARAAEVFVLYNEDRNGDAIDEEIINKIITPYARSICRVNGSKLNAVQFISGDDREIFQQNLQRTLSDRCEEQGVDIVQVAVTSASAPEEIRAPVRAREVAKQQLDQFLQEKIQQESQAELRVKNLLAEQKARLIEAEQEVVEQKTRAMQDQEVAVTTAEQRLAVAQTRLEAARSKAEALGSEARASADVIRFENEADLAGLALRVSAFGGDGGALARNVMIGKVAPAFRSILTNSDGPLMELFSQFATDAASPGPASTPPAAPPGPLAGDESTDPGTIPSNPFRTAEANR
ncbi:SPFH domain-containing protein [Tautonia plasticadhaerens]|uniref:SPFH domain / Band 7 family protein n=1 Tax=Tautonia plasticadhaerens TaxID=2527974 RepID=A0A518HB98_9BACT|nr:SPFH domain-containing protein [Tautonia plasticadhaerens]QDV38134.1 SPFH domain / Band 7 family protein [Tautonia plasticadhaerens]